MHELTLHSVEQDIRKTIDDQLFYQQDDHYYLRTNDKPYISVTVDQREGSGSPPILDITVGPVCWEFDFEKKVATKHSDNTRSNGKNLSLVEGLEQVVSLINAFQRAIKGT